MNNILLQLGPITIYWYSFLILVGFLSAYYIALKESKKNKTEQFLNDLIIHVMICGIIGARLYFCIFYGVDSFAEIIAIWNGGMAIYGGVIGGIIGVFIVSKIKNQEKNQPKYNI